MTDWFSVVLRGSGQFTTDTPLAGEQISIGGPDSVRGSASGEMSEDSGFATSLEAQFRPWPGVKVLVDFLVFADYGGRRVCRPTQDQHKSEHLAGAGVGLRIAVPNLGTLGDMSIRFDVARPLDPDRNQDRKDSVYYISGEVRF